MTNFHISLLDYSTSSLNLNILKKHLSDYKEEDWTRGSGNGLVSFSSPEGESSIIILQKDNLGLSVLLNLETDKNEEYVPIKDISKINSFVEVDDCVHQPEGSFLKPTEVLTIVKEYFQNPLKLPSSIEWQNTDDLEWPEL